jgi:hypothetical protein
LIAGDGVPGAAAWTCDGDDGAVAWMPPAAASDGEAGAAPEGKGSFAAAMNATLGKVGEKAPSRRAWTGVPKSGKDQPLLLSTVEGRRAAVKQGSPKYLAPRRAVAATERLPA